MYLLKTIFGRNKEKLTAK
uniref:Uncharacterized protein n=1 Tax=Anguilla anguilla TaxID=7936 RepID=A0A0E9QYR7_ANGAN